MRDLKLPVTSVHVHPMRSDHRQLWERRGYHVHDDPDCTWSDGGIGGFCCELYCNDFEIGTLVHTDNISTDVGFGLERIVQVVEQCRNVHESSLFMPNVHPIVADHVRSIQNLVDKKLQSGNRGQPYVLRVLLRQLLSRLDDISIVPFIELMRQEQDVQNKKFIQGRKMLKKYHSRSDQFWWETFGILPQERKML